MVTIDSIIDGILNREGRSYTNVPGDAGGPTKFGITLATLHGYRGKPVAPLDVQNLTEDEARQIYKRNYIQAPGYDKLTNLGLVEELIDAGVNHGVGTTIRLLQDILKMPQTGVLDTNTVAIANQAPGIKIVVLFLARRAHYYASILGPKSQHNWQFAAGWFNRLGFMIEEYGNQL